MTKGMDLEGVPRQVLWSLIIIILFLIISFLIISILFLIPVTQPFKLACEEKYDGEFYFPNSCLIEEHNQDNGEVHHKYYTIIKYKGELVKVDSE